MFPANFSLVSPLLSFSIFPAVAALIFFPTSSPATSYKQDHLADSAIIARDRLISQGITAYNGGYYAEAVYLLRNFLNRHRFINTPLEQAGINYLALAYQATGAELQARETILRGIAAENGSSLERANLEYTAGLIALQQQEITTANQHWQTARRLYLLNGDRLGWIKTSLGLAKNYEESGELWESRQLLEELNTKLRNNPN